MKVVYDIRSEGKTIATFDNFLAAMKYKNKLDIHAIVVAEYKEND